MSNPQEMQAYRTKLFQDVYNNVIPDRVPIQVSLCKEVVAELCGMDVREMNWNVPMLGGVADQICQKVYSDICPVNFFSTRFINQYEMSGSKSFKMSQTGFVQHPELSGMTVEDYDYLIEKPLDCLIERVIPRLFDGLNNPENPMLNAMTLAKTVAARNGDMFPVFGIQGRLNGQYGYYAPNGMARAMTTAPFDFIADQLRGFSQIPMDMRRNKEKLLAAVDAVYPLMVKAGIPAMLTPDACAYSFLHMPTFMRTKDFENFWWPSFLKMCNELASMGIRTETFCEDDWTRYLDYLQELPAGTMINFEYGDMKLIKEKLGKKMIITGLYPLTLLKTGTKDQCLDKAKEMLDILAPGGNFIFNFDKVIITAGSVNLDNLCAVTEYVRDNSKYSNAGQTAGIPFRKEDYHVDPTPFPESRYYKTAQDYMAGNPLMTPTGAAKLQAQDDALYSFMISQFLF